MNNTTRKASAIGALAVLGAVSLSPVVIPAAFAAPQSPSKQTTEVKPTLQELPSSKVAPIPSASGSPSLAVGTTAQPTESPSPTVSVSANASPTPSASASPSASPSVSPSASKAIVEDAPTVIQVSAGDKLSLSYPGFSQGDSVVFVIRDREGNSVYNWGVQVLSEGAVVFQVPTAQLGAGEYTITASSTGYAIRQQKLVVTAPEKPTPSATPSPTQDEKPAEPAATPSQKPTPGPGSHNQSNPDPVPSAGPTTKEEPSKSPEQVTGNIEVITASPSAPAQGNDQQKKAAALEAEREQQAAANQAPAREPGDNTALAAAPIARSNAVTADAEKVSATSIVAAPIARAGHKDQDADKGAPSNTTPATRNPAAAPSATAPAAESISAPAAAENTSGTNPVLGIGLGALSIAALGGGAWWLFLGRKKQN